MVPAVARRDEFLGDDVEPRQVDILVVAQVETPAYLVDIPLVGRDAVFGRRKVHFAAVQLAPVNRGAGVALAVALAVVNLVDDRVGKYHDDLAFGRGCAQACRSVLHGSFEGIHAAAAGEPIVDQLFPLRLSGREPVVLHQPNHVGVITAVGTAAVLEFDEQEAVEQPMFLALFVHVAHARGETLLVPAVRGAVVAAAVT